LGKGFRIVNKMAAPFWKESASVVFCWIFRPALLEGRQFRDSGASHGPRSQIGLASPVRRTIRGPRALAGTSGLSPHIL
jgi:hypothetical protein